MRNIVLLGGKIVTGSANFVPEQLLAEARGFSLAPIQLLAEAQAVDRALRPSSR